MTPYIVSGKLRMIIINYLNISPKTPSWIAKDSSKSIQSVSRVLKGLLEKKLVERHLSNAKIKAKFYSLTEEGEKLAKNLEELGYF